MGVVITFGLGAVTAATEAIKFKVEAKANNDINLANNKKDVSIKIELVAGLAVTGAANLDSVKWQKNANKTKTPGTEIIFTFLFQNQGPSSVDYSKALMKLPEKKDGKYFLNFYKIEDGSTTRKNIKVQCAGLGEKKVEGLNPLNLE